MEGGDLAAPRERAERAGAAAFGRDWRPDRIATAPGRIELLGNHIDYNGGPVLCAAIDRSVVVLADAAGDPIQIAAVAADAPELGVARVPAAAGDWRNAAPPPNSFDYVRGIAAAASRAGLPVRSGARLAFAGDVPIGFGLSSSAALCVGLGLASLERRPPFAELVLLAQAAEHRAGTPCGTMDQSASVAGGVIRYDGATLAIDRLDPDLGEFVFAVADSGVERALGASSYPVRVQESQAALAFARRALNRHIDHLAALSDDDVQRLAAGPEPLPEPLLSRVRHVVAETGRVRDGEAALAVGDWPRFGRLMTASGHSSATLYAISHPRVEELAAEALAVEGVLGARMMGGGEGGAALVLLPRARLKALAAALRGGYYRQHDMAEQTGLIHPCRFAPGARVEKR
ncbi:MAG TPA: galactokinase family protein [Thermomicrobiales bacterium]|nr:galactokinase family protein [Thermomicrobiales bacterium]